MTTELIAAPLRSDAISDELAKLGRAENFNTEAPDSVAIVLPVGVSKGEKKTPTHRSIQRKPARPLIPKDKAGKLQVAKSGGRQEAWTVEIDRQTKFRIRLTESGYSVILTWKDAASGKWPERYCCYLSKPEWSQARRQTLANFAVMIVGKVEQRKATEGNDVAKLDALIARIQPLT